jgi:hypothetical protein
MIIDAYILSHASETLADFTKNARNGSTFPEVYGNMIEAKKRAKDLGNWKITKIKIEEIILSPMQAAKEALESNNYQPS